MCKKVKRFSVCNSVEFGDKYIYWKSATRIKEEKEINSIQIETEEVKLPLDADDMISYTLTLCDPMDCSLQGSSVHGILQASILEWVTISFSRGSSQPRD